MSFNICITDIYYTGSWMLTTMGTVTTPNGEHNSTLWFCPSLRCTSNNVVVQQITNYKWGAPQGCVRGTLVSVIGELNSDDQRRIVESTGVVIQKV